MSSLASQALRPFLTRKWALMFVSAMILHCPPTAAHKRNHVARSFGDTNLVVATFQEGRFENYGAVDCGYAISQDGGLSWTRALIPHLTKLVGGPLNALRTRSPELICKTVFSSIRLGFKGGSPVPSSSANRPMAEPRLANPSRSSRHRPRMRFRTKTGWRSTPFPAQQRRAALW